MTASANTLIHADTKFGISTLMFTQTMQQMMLQVCVIGEVAAPNYANVWIHCSSRITKNIKEPQPPLSRLQVIDNMSN